MRCWIGPSGRRPRPVNAERRQLGWLDANLFIHPFFRDPLAETCKALLADLQQGKAEGFLDLITIHELTYALYRHVFRQDRKAVADYLSTFIGLETVQVENKPAVLKALYYWAADPTCDSFGDARLRALAEATGLPVCTANRKHFRGIPNTFPFRA